MIGRIAKNYFDRRRWGTCIRPPGSRLSTRNVRAASWPTSVGIRDASAARVRAATENSGKGEEQWAGLQRIILTRFILISSLVISSLRDWSFAVGLE